MKFSYYKIGLLVLMIVGVSIVLGLAVDLLLNHPCPDAKTVNVQHRFPNIIRDKYIQTIDNDSMVLQIKHTNIHRMVPGTSDTSFYVTYYNELGRPIRASARFRCYYALDTNIADTICYRKEECK